MSVNSRKIGRFLLTAGLLVVLAQGLWQLPDLQDYISPDNHWELDLLTLNNESYKIEDGLTSLRLRVDYLKWFLEHRGPAQRVSMDWMLHFPFSESIRSFFPKFFWNLNIYLAFKNQVQLQRKLKYIDALVQYIKLNKKQKLSPNLNDILLNYDKFQRLFITYHSELIKLEEQLQQLSTNSYKQ
jgi:hypothetical protein